MTPKTNKKTIVGLLMLAIVFMAMTGKSQDRYVQTGSSIISIAGTSTLHDWTMTTSEATCEAAFEMNAQGKPASLTSLVVTIAAESLKSGKNAMDKNAYAALKTDKHKQITFQLVSAKIEGKTIQINGKLTIAGVTRPVEVQATFETLSDGTMQFKGTRQIMMTDYNVEPPSFMFGSVTTGNEITVAFDMVLTPRK